MKIESIQEVANETYAAFQQKIGSNQIATRQALRVIGKELCLMEKPNILEFGAGIGTITFFVLKLGYDFGSYYAVEKDQWCRARLEENCSFVDNSKIVLIDVLKEIPSEVKFDVLIIDDFLDFEEFNTLIDHFSLGKIIIEGHRNQTRLQIALKLRELSRKFSYINIGPSEDSHKGAALFVVTDGKQTKLMNLQIVARISCRIFISRLARLRSRLPLRKILRLPSK